MRYLPIAILLCGLLPGQGNESWRRPFPPHRIAGNLYYAGTEDLACFLIATPRGHILINTGLAGSTPLIRASMRTLGYRLEDVKILLTMQAHFDHVAAMKEVQEISHARVFATEADAPVLEDGGRSDPYFGKAQWFAPVKVDRRLRDGEVIGLGGTELTVMTTPGHTKGSVSYRMTVMDQGRKLSVAIVNLNSVVMPLVGNSKYPRIVADYEESFARQKALTPDIWVAGHASQYNMQAKWKAGSFVDPEGYQRAIAEYERAFRARLAEESGGAGGSRR